MRTHSRSGSGGIAGAALLAAAAAFALTSTASAQLQVGSGHALDGSLEVGTDGYNTRVGTQMPLTARRYAPYASQAWRSYALPSSVVPSQRYYAGSPYSNYNTFINDRYYSAVRNPQAVAYSSAGLGSARLNYRVYD